MYSKKNNLKKLITLATALAFIVPAIVTASVVVDYTINYKTSSVQPNVELETGPNYYNAMEQGLIFVSNITQSATSSGSVQITDVSGSVPILRLNSTEDTEFTVLENVLEIVSSSTSPLEIYLNSSLSGVQIYITSSPLDYQGAVSLQTSTLSSGTSVIVGAGPSISAFNLASVTGSTISFESSGAGTYYISFVIDGEISSQTGTISLQYTTSIPA